MEMLFYGKKKILNNSTNVCTTVWMLSPAHKVGTDSAYACSPTLEDGKMPTKWQEFDELGQIFHPRRIQIRRLPTSNWKELLKFELNQRQKSCLLKYGNCSLLSDEFERERRRLFMQGRGRGGRQRSVMIRELTASNLASECHDIFAIPLKTGGSLFFGSTKAFQLLCIFPKSVAVTILDFFSQQELMSNFEPDVMMYEIKDGSRILFDIMINMPRLKYIAATFFTMGGVHRSMQIQNGTLIISADWNQKCERSHFHCTALLKLDFFGISATYDLQQREERLERKKGLNSQDHQKLFPMLDLITPAPLSK